MSYLEQLVQPTLDCSLPVPFWYEGVGGVPAALNFFFELFSAASRPRDIWLMRKFPCMGLAGGECAIPHRAHSRYSLVSGLFGWQAGRLQEK